jgi:hypothetical protein
MDIDEEWESFINDEDFNFAKDTNYNKEIPITTNSRIINTEVPEPTDIYISTKTKIAFLNKKIDILKIFWEIPIIEYGNPSNGIVKKQIKINSNTQEDLDYYKEKLKNYTCFNEQIINHIDNPNGRIRFKDIRKISIGLSKKDILSYRSKKKSAFYNCFVIIIRIKIKEKFQEYHVKVFNTGKLEIPGVQDDYSFNEILSFTQNLLNPLTIVSDDSDLSYVENSLQTVLINSNFNCNFFIDREKLFQLLKNKYNIQCIYDPCSYPGIQSKFYYDPNKVIQTGSPILSDANTDSSKIVQVSFMIFRTGSVLIVGKCYDEVLKEIYDFVKNLLINEYDTIYQNQPLNTTKQESTQKIKKVRKKTIINKTLISNDIEPV